MQSGEKKLDCRSDRDCDKLNFDFRWRVPSHSRSMDYSLWLCHLARAIIPRTNHQVIPRIDIGVLWRFKNGHGNCGDARAD